MAGWCYVKLNRLKLSLALRWLHIVIVRLVPHNRAPQLTSRCHSSATCQQAVLDDAAAQPETSSISSWVFAGHSMVLQLWATVLLCKLNTLFTGLAILRGHELLVTWLTKTPMQMLLFLVAYSFHTPFTLRGTR